MTLAIIAFEALTLTIAAAAAAVLVAIHLFIGQLWFLNAMPRSRLLSAAGGASVAYVLMHLLPELSKFQSHIETHRVLAAILDRHVYIMALLGLSLFYGMERLIRIHRKDTPPGASTGVFYLHIASFAVYSAIIAYLLLHREAASHLSEGLFAVAMALHFVTSDFGLHKHHAEAYGHTARWVLSAAVIAGLVLGLFVNLPKLVLAAAFSFVSGAMILNILKEELPEDRDSRFWPFAAGAAAYAALLLLL